MKNALVYVFFACALQAFAPPKAEEPQRLVELDVAATGAKGDPVTDLKAEEIHLREDGKPHPLVFFQFAGSKRPLPPPAQGEFSNHPSPPPMVVLLDRWNEQQMATAQARNALRTALQSLKSVDNVYIYALTYRGELSPIRPLPETDGDLRAEPAPSRAELLAKVDAAVADTQGFRAPDIDQVRAPKTFQALERLASQMALLPGRKNLMWVTDGVAIIERDATRRLLDFTKTTLELSEIFGRAHVSMYTVQHSVAGGANDLNAAWRLSALTGGRWYGNDGIDQAVADAAADAEASYRIAYFSAAREGNQKEHPIRLDSTRKGVRLLTREGLFLLPEPSAEDEEDMAFRAGRRSSVDAAGIGLRVTMSRKQAPAAGTMHFDIRVDWADILLERSGDGYEGHLAVMAALYSEGFLKEALPPVHLDVKLTQAALDRAGKDGVIVPLDAPVGEDIRNVRVMVYDPGVRGLGTVTIPVK